MESGSEKVWKNWQRENKMKLDMSYADFSLLRELVKAKQMSIWKKEWASRLDKDISLDKISEIFHQVMETDVGPCEEDFQNLLTDRGCCAMLLHRFEKMEKELQTVLGMRK